MNEQNEQIVEVEREMNVNDRKWINEIVERQRT